MDKINMSIIVPIYNVERYLSQCLDSLLKAAHVQSIEILLIDDGSTDESGRIADEYTNNYKNIQVFHKNNGGLSDARNYGILRSKGKYIFFMDADDMIDSICFEEAINYLEQNDVDIFLWDAILINEDNNEILDGNMEYYSHSGLTELKFYTGEEAIELQLLDHNDYVTTVWLGAYRKELIIDNHLWFEKDLLHEDEMWTPKVILSSDKVVYFNKKLYFYRQRSDSIMGSLGKDSSHNIMSNIYIYSTLYSYITWKIQNKKLAKLLKGNISKRYLYMIKKFRVYKYRNQNKLINKIEILKNSLGIVNCSRALILLFSTTLYCRLSYLIVKDQN